MDWYRKTTWTENDQNIFFEKLNRARIHSRPQYLRIQALTLISTTNQELINEAEILLNKILDEYPEEKFEKSLTLKTLGDIYKSKNNFEKAIQYYKNSLEFEQEYPNVKTTSYLEFAELIVKTKKNKEFNYVEGILEATTSESLFPVEKYKGYAILSIINSHKKNFEKASAYEKLANENADAKTTNLQYHKYLGIVKERDSWLDKIMKRK